MEEYVETSPAAAMPAILLDTLYELDINNPYITIMVLSDGGPTNYLIEYGRVDEREYLTAAISLFLPLLSSLLTLTELC